MKTMRKIIAVLAAALMLCSVVPMSVLAAPGDVVLDKNFDSDNGGFERAVAENGYIVFDATTANWQNTYAYVNGIKADTNYKVTFQAKANKECKMNFKVNNNWTGDVFAEAVDVTTEWQDYEISMSNLALTGTAIVMFTSGYEAANAPIYYIDNLKIVEVIDPALIGKVINGDFETGDKTGWEIHQSSVIDAAAAHNGSYGAHLKGNGSWGGMMNQTVYATPGKTYEITLSVKVIASGVNVQIKDGDGNGASLASGWFDKNAAGEWITKTFLVSPTTESIFINFCGGGNGVAEEIYVDDVSALELKDPSFDGYITNGDFETAKTDSWESVWGSAQIAIVEGRNGGSAMSVDAGMYQVVRQKVNVQPNTNYVVRAYGKNAANMTLLVKDGNDSGNIAQTGFASGEDFVQTSLNFNSGSYSQVYICIMGNVAGSHVVVDDFFMFEKKDPSNDGYLINGTFETGDLSPWNNLWGSCPKAEVVTGGKDDSFALDIVSGQWKHVRQLPIAVEANTDYRITVWGKNVKDMNLLVKDNGDTTNVANVAINGGEEWTENVIEFNSGSYTAILVSFMGGSENACGTFDNIVMECLTPACEHEYEYDCSKVCTLCGKETRPEAHHEYIYACDPYCNSCGEKTNPRAKHNKIHVEAKEATCQAPGNIEYWYCDHCGSCWDNAEGTGFPLNAMTVKIFVDHDLGGIPICQDGVCATCGETIPGWECEYYPICQDGNCLYCGELLEARAECESDAEIPCATGNCLYCGEPVAGSVDHTFVDGVCDVCGEEDPNYCYHEYFFSCDPYCMNCGELTNPDAAHTLSYTAATEAASCKEYGNVEYWSCDECGSCWLDEDCTQFASPSIIRVPGPCVSDAEFACQAGTCVNCGQPVEATEEHEYFYACDQRCMMCGELTNEEAAHNIVHVDAVEAADCQTLGNIEYWYCDLCGSAWADEAQTIVTNMMSVRTGYGDHSYDDDYDVDCNVCGDIREVTLPVTVITADGTSVAEENNSLAFRFVVKATDVGLEQINKYVEGSAKIIPFSDGVEYTLIRMGTIVSNQDGAVLDLEHLDGRKVVNSPVVRLYSVDAENGELSFATRVINIPNVGKDTPISTRPYYVYEQDGVEIVVYGDTVTTSYDAAQPTE